MTSELSYDVLSFDMQEEINNISQGIKQSLRSDLNKRGLVVAISGGIDSSVCAALSVSALGKNKVFGLLLPEQDSSSKSSDRGELLAQHLGIEYQKKDIASTLREIGCYEWRDNAIRELFPDYNLDWKNKIVISGGLEGKYNHFKLVVESPDGEMYEKKLALKQYLQIVAATNYKQRIRKTVEYFHADRLNYAVVGTPNRLEYDQGFFVKNGDGSADIKPIAHLYKSQVYDLAKHMNLPDEICSAVPTTDTYSLSQGQDEFYFALPYKQMDIALWAYENDIPATQLGVFLNVDEKKALLIYKDIEAKRKAAVYLHHEPVLLSSI